ncbi:MAG: ATP-binding protein, partial [bacterium]|nr:ATP-binding protein [Candidatus Kapabacteria bacterium]
MAFAREFLTHGLLPFVGRSDEAERIGAFWRGTFESTCLRVMVLSGEAGIGKSRLIAETMPALIEAGAVVVHVRLVPESTTSVIAPIAQALHHVQTSRSATPIEPSITGVTIALRRLSRLRATIVVIEDVQLLEGDSVLELTALLTALTDESLAVMCALRPVVTPSRAAIERFVVDEIALSGLPTEAIDEMWRLMTSGSPTAELSTALHTTTLGNPLALRSALRGALASGALSPKSGGEWQLAEESAAFVRRLGETVGMVVDGLTLALTPAQRTSTERLAMLGEVFSREAATIVVGESERVLEELCELGIIANAPPSATPFARATSARGLLAFTHSLLHRALL